MSRRPLSPRLFFLLLALPFLVTPASAQTITSPSGGYVVGINGSVGNLFDVPSNIGFLRVADGYDPILPGTPREAWGIAAGAVSGYADPNFVGVLNVAANGSSFLANSASVSTFLNAGSGNLLQVDQSYSFAANNVLKIFTTVTNVSGSSQAVLFSRHVDWDIVPTPFAEVITVPAFGGSVLNASFFGFESPDPLVSFSSPGPGVFGPGDLGAAFLLDLGSLANGDSISFNIFHGLSDPGQSEAGLTAQITGLGASYVITGADSGAAGAPSNFAALAFGAVAVPEPTTWALIGVVTLGTGAYSWNKRRKAKQDSFARLK